MKLHRKMYICIRYSECGVWGVILGRQDRHPVKAKGDKTREYWNEFSGEFVLNQSEWLLCIRGWVRSNSCHRLLCAWHTNTPGQTQGERGGAERNTECAGLVINNNNSIGWRKIFKWQWVVTLNRIYWHCERCVGGGGRKEGGGRTGRGSGQEMGCIGRVPAMKSDECGMGTWRVISLGCDDTGRRSSYPVSSKHLCGQGGAHNEWSPHPHDDIRTHGTLATGIRGSPPSWWRLYRANILTRGSWWALHSPGRVSNLCYKL